MTSLRIMPFQAWPELDRRLWLSAFDPGEGLLDRGPGASLTEKDVRNVRKLYGQALTFCREQVGPPEQSAPLERFDRPFLKAYYDFLQTCISRQSGKPLSPVTIKTRIHTIYRVLRLMYPEADLAWMRSLVSRIAARARPVRRKDLAVRPITDLYDAGLELIAGWNADGNRDFKQQAIAFRDGLLLAILSIAALRRANHTTIEIGRHLTRRQDGYWLRFPSEELKSRGADHEFPLPAELTPAIDEYLRVHRLSLLGNRQSERLWITLRGSPMSEQAVYYAVRRAGKRGLDVRLWPHLARDCAATSVANGTAPDTIIPRVLSHSAIRTAERWYIHADSMRVSRELADAIAERRTGDTESDED